MIFRLMKSQQRSIHSLSNMPYFNIYVFINLKSLCYGNRASKKHHSCKGLLFPIIFTNIQITVAIAMSTAAVMIKML